MPPTSSANQPPAPPRRAAWTRRGLGRAVLVALLVALVASGVAVAAWPPARVALQTLILLPSLFPGAPLQPLPLLTPPPTRSEHTFTYAGGAVEVDIYHPGTVGPHGGVILHFGARPVPRRDPLLVQVAESLARTGLVVLLPESANQRTGGVLADEVEALLLSYDLLLEQPELDPARTGLLGFSVGGALSIVAATQPPLRDGVRLVNSMGGYFDALVLLVDMASRSIVVDGVVVPWEPSPITVEVLATQLIVTLPDDEDRVLLARAFLEGEVVEPAAWQMLGPAGQAVRVLLSGATREEARAALDRLPPSTLAALRAASPATHIEHLRAHLYLMHDTGDAYIPFTQARALVLAAPPGVVQRYTEFSIFEHLTPDRPVPVGQFAADVWALFWHVHAILLELL